MVFSGWCYVCVGYLDFDALVCCVDCVWLVVDCGGFNLICVGGVFVVYGGLVLVVLMFWFAMMIWLVWYIVVFVMVAWVLCFLYGGLGVFICLMVGCGFVALIG